MPHWLLEVAAYVTAVGVLVETGRRGLRLLRRMLGELAELRDDVMQARELQMELHTLAGAVTQVMVRHREQLADLTTRVRDLADLVVELSAEQVRIIRRLARLEGTDDDDDDAG